MAGVKGLEPSTSCVTGRRSNQLSYTPIQDEHTFIRFFLKLQYFFCKKMHFFYIFFIFAIFQYLAPIFLGPKKQFRDVLHKKWG